MEIEANVFDANSINDIVQKLLLFKSLKLNRLEKVVNEVADIGVETISSLASEVEGGYNVNAYKDVVRNNNSVSCRVYANCPDIYVAWKVNKGDIKGTNSVHGYYVNPLLLAEFGSGHYVENLYPDKFPDMTMGSLSYTVGTGQVDKPQWSYVDLQGNERHWTSGVQPTHPMFNASQRMREELKKRKVSVT